MTRRAGGEPTKRASAIGVGSDTERSACLGLGYVGDNRAALWHEGAAERPAAACHHTKSPGVLTTALEGAPYPGALRLRFMIARA
jgi:hypothetical protein